MNTKNIIELVLWCTSLIVYVSIYMCFTDFLVQRGNLKKGFIISSLLIVAVLLLATTDILHEYLFCMLPVLYIVNTLMSRYIFFNSFTKKIRLQKLTSPYDPIIMYAGAIFASWGNEKRKNITVLEVIYSLWILGFPFYVLIFISKFI